MKAEGLGASEIAKALKIGRASVYRLMERRRIARHDSGKPARICILRIRRRLILAHLRQGGSSNFATMRIHSVGSTEPYRGMNFVSG